MRILVDQHHADLLYSLQRLFEDRLGVEVFIPLGHEWWDDDYWQFGRVFGDDRLAQQYLNLKDGIHAASHDHFFTVDPAHPERVIRGVTVEQAREMSWDFVMPTVQENQQGFARFAQEQNARFLVQVGNTGQRVDWSLSPLVINTSELEIPEGRGVTIHQEIDSHPGGAFGFVEPYDRRTVRSFVNAFNRIPGYDKFLSVENMLGPVWNFTVHGHEGRDGNINPVSAMGAAQASAGWGWHQKPVGDGFGHVIHSWAAVGRPLIGQASYYNGKLAGPFWQDGVTSIDTMTRPLHEVVRLMEEIASDKDRHDEMCHAIRATFDRLVNYEHEADLVRSALGL